jgi:hypothetical protein
MIHVSKTRNLFRAIKNRKIARELMVLEHVNYTVFLDWKKKQKEAELQK